MSGVTLPWRATSYNSVQWVRMGFALKSSVISFRLSSGCGNFLTINQGLYIDFAKSRGQVIHEEALLSFILLMKSNSNSDSL